MSPRGLLLSLAIGALACRPSVEVIAPELEAVTLIYIEDDVDPRASVVRVEPGAEARFHLGNEQGLWALAYDVPPEALGLEVGELTLYSVENDDRRPLPLPNAARRLALSDVPSWMAVAAPLSETLPKWWIANLPTEACVAYGGCYASADDQKVRRCLLPCEPMSPRPPIAPLPPDAPSIECPSTWTVQERATGADPPTVRLCQPPDLPNCPPGEMAIVDGSCAPIDGPCPSGRFAEDLPTDRRLIFVDRSSPLGGDGTLAAPFPGMGEALAEAASGDAIVIAKGVYIGQWVITRDLLLIGACSQGTTLYFLGGPGPILMVDGGVELRSLSLERVGGSSALTTYPPEVTLRDVSIDSSVIGIHAYGGLRVERLKVRSTSVALDMTGSGESRVFADTVDLESSDSVAVRSEHSLASSFRGFVLRGGLRWGKGARLDLESGLITSSSVAIVTDVSGCVTATQLGINNGDIRARGCFDASALTMHHGGIVLDEARWTGTDMTIEDPPVRGILSTSSTLSLERVAIVDAHGAGIAQIFGVSELGSLIVLDTIAATPRVLGDDLVGTAVLVRDLEGPGWTQMTMSRSLIARSAGSGVLFLGDGDMEVSDLRVDDSGTDPANVSTNAVSAHGPSHLVMSAIEVRRAEGTGIWVQGPLDAESSVEDLRVEGAGHGLRFPAIAEGDGVRNHLSTIHRISISESLALGMCVGVYWLLDAEDVSVRDTRTRPTEMADFCFGMTRFSGVGVGVGAHARLELERFEVSRSEERGFFQTPLGDLVIHDGTIAENPIAIDASDRPLTDFLLNVRFRDNGQLLAPH